MASASKDRWATLLLVSIVVKAVTAIADQSIGQWTHIDNVPGGTACAARLAGNDIDTMLMINGAEQLILVAGRADWHVSGPQEVGLRIDGFELSHLKASAFNNIVLLPIDDLVVQKRLASATDLYWTLSSGRYHASVTGLGDALEWVRQCEQNKRRPTV